jgi:hypothetical protein
MRASLLAKAAASTFRFSRGAAVKCQRPEGQAPAADAPRAAQENLVRKAIVVGVDPQEAYLKYGKF